MTIWNTITPAALLGVGRSMPSVDLPPPFAELLTGSEGETRLLKACGILGVAGAAGRISPAPSDPLPAPAPIDEQSCLPEIVPIAQRILEEARGPVVSEMCALLTKSSRSLPPRLLPSALELGRKTASLRGPLRDVLGPRGAWLAAQNPDWAFALLAGRETADRRLWEEGDANQRAAYLRYFRQEDAASARSLLEASFPQDTARDRAILLPALGENLSPDDEAFLTRILSEDRSKEVRQTAAVLLSRLPESAFARDITAWLEPCLRTERKLFRTTTTIEPPAAFDPSWKAKTIEEKPPASMKLGERAWWLLQLVSLAPLGWWESRLGTAPADILALAVKSDWNEALLRGFRTALSNQPEATAWILAFLEMGGSSEMALDLALRLPPAKADEAFQKIFSSLSDLGHAIRAIEAADFTWSPQLWRSVRQKLPQWLNQQDWRFRATLGQLACRIPPACLYEELSWPDAPFYLDAIAEFSQIVDQRRTLHHYLNP
jgi:hypothetical protein